MHDLVASSGFTDIFWDTKTLYCTQHMQERDAFKLQSVGCNQWSKQKIMADIYGCPSDALPQSEPADANLKVSKMSGKKQLLLFTNGFEKQGRNNSKTPLSCQQDQVLVSKDTSPPTDSDWSTSQSKHETLATKYGVYYSSLLQLENFNPLRFTAIDPMHNLFLGTAKHVFKLWIEKNLLSKKDLKVLEDRINSFDVGTGIGWLPHRIASNYGGYMASQWKNWILIYSICCLKDLLPETHLRCWQTFFLACQ